METFPKQPNESYPISVDFSNLTDTGETITTYTVNVYLSTTDVTNTIIDSHYKTTTSVILNIKDGTDNLNYKITVKIITSNGNTYENDVMMEVREI
jgi:hypothetical protein